MPDERWKEKVVGLLDQLAGLERGNQLLERLLASNASARAIASEIASSATVEKLYKTARAGAAVAPPKKEANPAFVGLTEFDAGGSFESQFERYFQPRLGKRADGFSAIFESLLRGREKPFIIETGCLRIPGNWEGDGQSTFMFDALVKARGGFLVSVDCAIESIDTARRACSSTANLIVNDSVAALHAISTQFDSRADLLYLDSFDLNVNDPMPSAIHHAMELMAANRLIGPGTIVCVDDYSVGSHVGGKGLILDSFFSSIAADVLYSGYQKAWRLR